MTDISGHRSVTFSCRDPGKKPITLTQSVTLRVAIRELHISNLGPDTNFLTENKKRGKSIPVIGCETSRIPHFLDNRLTDGGEVVSLTRRPHVIPRKIPGTHFC
jgi:hypothetical protein